LIKRLWQIRQNVPIRVFWLRSPSEISTNEIIWFDALGSIMGLGTILRISFLECKSTAVDLWFIFLHRVAGTPQLASTWDSGLHGIQSLSWPWGADKGNVVMHHFMLGMCSEKCVIRWWIS
jgi:hypothetical protein